MNKSAVVHARIEPKTKASAERVLQRLGLSPTEAIRIFYRQITLRGGIPFPIHVPNKLTEKTLAKSRSGREIQQFDSLDEMFASWDKMRSPRRKKRVGGTRRGRLD
jgi:DNA-damage-inducible protein J